MALRDLNQGMHGEDVRAVQNGLNTYFGSTRPVLVPDGVFGPATLAAVNAFQQANPGTGKPDGRPDGIVGRRTRRRLFPLAVVSLSSVGFRLRMPVLRSRSLVTAPRLGPGPLQWPGAQRPTGLDFNPNANVLRVDWLQQTSSMRLDFTPQRFPGLRVPLAAPSLVAPPLPNFLLDPPRWPPTPTRPPLWNPWHHFELAPGAQMNLAQPSQTAFTLGFQGVAMLGDDDGPHQEFALGVQAGSPNADGSGDWNFTWYAQITDVDRLGALGKFHWWQPYAQVGVQQVPRSFGPVITGSLFPVNLGLDLTDRLTISVAGGLGLTFDPRTGVAQAGIQGTAGLILKLGAPPAPAR